MKVQTVLPAGYIRTINANFDLIDDVVGERYYVDFDAGNDDDDGSNWETAWKHLSTALEASHATHAASPFGQSARNRVYYKSSGELGGESLTKLARNTDIIGVGTAQRLIGARLIGTHTIGHGNYQGCRFINFDFICPATGGVIFDLPAILRGMHFVNCTFDANSDVEATSAIVATSVDDLHITGCWFKGKFAGPVIAIGAGASNSLMIADNFIQGENMGISFDVGARCNAQAGYVINNVINTDDICINDLSGKFYIHGNRCVTKNAKGVVGAGAIVGGASMMLDNRVSCSDVENAALPPEGTL